MTPRGVLVLSHGTPARRDEIEPFYTRIRHGAPPTPALLADLERRYDAIGGLSPLTARTDEQVQGLAATLEARAPGSFLVEGGTKYAEPTIEDAARHLVARGAEDVVGVVLAPLRAPMTSDQYHDRAAAALGSVRYRPVWSWWAQPGFAELEAVRVHDAIAASGTATPLVLFSAHSLPVRVVTDDDYPRELAAAAAAVAGVAGLERHATCWQSAGRTKDEWLGPDLLELLGALDPATTPAVVVCPVGFVADHLEVLYDVDVEAAAVAAARGLRLVRTASLNADPSLLAVLADVVRAAAA